MGCSVLGSFSTFPENTIASFNQAQKLGAHGIELDVWLTDANEVIVVHGLKNEGFLHYTCLENDGGVGKQLGRDITAQNFSGVANKLQVKKPWVLFENIQKEDLIHKLAELDDEGREKHKNKYLECTETWKKDEDSKPECVPLLEEVLKFFGGKLRYNIELKGTKPELGPKVLEILAKFPNLDVIISSFLWIPPPLSESSKFAGMDMEVQTNGPSECDLLKPLVDNNLNIPLGLLFNRRVGSLCSIDRIIECAKSYKAKYVCVAHNFWKSENGVLGETPPCGINVLNNLVKRVHDSGLKVLAYWLQVPPDNVGDFKAHISAGVDVLCVNDVDACIKLM